MTHTDILRVVSGGQTGADIAGVEWAKENGLRTGGMMPYGFKTDNGNRPEYAAIYGMQEHCSASYPPRTEYNVRNSTVTIIFGNLASPGSRLTARLCVKYHKPYLPIVFTDKTQLEVTPYLHEWTNSLFEDDQPILNVAGNRERTNPGINAFVKKWLTAWKDWCTHDPV